jgi:hypothetical protein
MADLGRDFWIRETGTGQKAAQLLDRYMMMMMMMMMMMLIINECVCRFFVLCEELPPASPVTKYPIL